MKVNLSATYRIANPRTALMTVADFAATLYAELQQALRAAVSTSEIEALLANRGEIGPQILAQCQPTAERHGLVLEQVAQQQQAATLVFNMSGASNCDVSGH